MKRTLSQLLWKMSVPVVVVVMVLGISDVLGQSSSYGDIGVGGGLSYGGLGTRFTYLPIEKLGLFGSLGYNLDALGYNLGAQFHIPSQKKLGAYITGMYGYNTVLIVQAIDVESKTTYFGFSTGVGITYKIRDKSYICAEVLVPFRPQAFKDAVDDLESIDFEIKDLMPVVFSVGFHFKILRK